MLSMRPPQFYSSKFHRFACTLHSAQIILKKFVHIFL